MTDTGSEASILPDDAGPYGRPAGSQAEGHPASAREINQTIRYAMWSVFRVDGHLPEDRPGLAFQVERLFKELRQSDVVVRGVYNLAGLRADADIMIWLHAPTSEGLQAAYARMRQTRLGHHLVPVWSQMALHRPAEFNQGHVPAFMADESPRAHLCVYPFVRSYEWYLLQDEERRAMLVEHGMMGREYPDVRANTVASFGLGDYEWILAFEADDLYRIVDLMRHLRGSEARRHVRMETPFYTGARIAVADLVNSLP